jgi:preprotein translocase subunit SecA
LFNLEVEVSGAQGVAGVQAPGLGQSGAPANRLSYSAPSEDASGQVEVRDQRGQVERAATARAQQAAQQQQRSAGQQQTPAPRGAFGQPTSAEAPPMNRAERRAREKNGG